MLKKAITSTFQFRPDQLARLLDVARFMSVEKNLDRLLDYIGEQVTSALSADRCGIFLLDETRSEIWSKVASGSDREIRFPVGTGIAGATISSGQPILIPDAYKDDRFNRKIDEETGYRTRDILCVPLTNIDGKAIGCFQLINKIEGTFDSKDQDFLIAFGAQAAVAIESAQLYQQSLQMIADLEVTQERLQQKMRQLEVVYELEREANELESSDEFMQIAIERAASAAGAEAGSILLLDETKKSLKFTHRIGEKSDQLQKITLDKTEGIAGRVLEGGEPIIDNDIGKNRDHSKRTDNELGLVTHSMIAIPLELVDVNRKQPMQRIGVLEIINHKSGSFTDEDLAFLQTISAQISSMIMRRQLMEERQQGQRLATLGQLSSSIIHDFKNPMAAIKGFAELIGDGVAKPEKVPDYCKIITAQVDRCVNMTSEVLAFARGDKNYNFETVDLKEFFSEVSMILGVETERHGIELDVQCHFEGTIELDSERFKRVIFNLTNNAIEVMGKGGKLSVHCNSSDAGDAGNKGMVIRVRDTGPGIPDAIRDTLFDAFATHDKKGGTGLGLHITKQIVENHGGAISLDEDYQSGAGFVIVVPTQRSS